MDCQDFKNHLLDLALNEVPSSERERLEHHARTCATCALPFSQMTRVRDLLKAGWRDEEVPRSLVFTPVSPSAPTGFWGWLLAAPQWANVSMATAAALVILFAMLSFARADFHYDQGHWALSFGQSRSSRSSPQTSSAVPAANASITRAEIERIVNAQYASLSQQDREQYAAMLERLSQQIQVQRQEDLRRIGSAFDQVKTVVWKEMQRNNAIVQYAAQRIVTNAKN